MLEVREVSFRYEDMMMDFSLRVGAGECLAVIGPSGGGQEYAVVPDRRLRPAVGWPDRHR